MNDFPALPEELFMLKKAVYEQLPQIHQLCSDNRGRNASQNLSKLETITSLSAVHEFN